MSEMEQLTFIPIKTAKVDAKGRFYLPNEIVKQLFGDTPENEREVTVYLGPGGRVLIMPAAYEE